MNFDQEQIGAVADSSLLEQLPMALFDELECGLIVCDRQGAIRFANQAARLELATSAVLGQGGGRLARAATASGDDLDTALQQAAQRGRRTLVRLEQGSARLLVSVLPFRLSNVSEPMALVMLGRRRACSELGIEMLAASYKLTQAEREVLAGLVREATPREIAAERAVKLSTVRTQISSLRGKLGTRTIEGLLLRAAEVPPVASALRIAYAASTSSTSSTASCAPTAPTAVQVLGDDALRAAA